MAQETVEIVQRGWYQTASGIRVDIADEIAESLAETRLLTPEKLGEFQQAQWPRNCSTQIEVENDTTLAAASRYAPQGKPEEWLCLNFASAKSPGGGYLSGSLAQEESLARSSALAATLKSKWDYYEINRGCDTAFYTDHMILSPNVPVFRDDSGTLLDCPYRVSFLSAPAVNAGAVRSGEPDRSGEINQVMADRIDKVLSVAAHFGYRHLILGAWGCGVFRNDPREIAQLFANVLLDTGRFAHHFASITFAVLDNTEDRSVVRPFVKLLGPID